MASEDPIDFAHTAIAQVANIASLLGVESKRPLCGRLGAELFLVANYIDTAGLDQERQLRLRISKLLRDVEAMCNWPKNIPTNDYPLLEAIAKPFPDGASYEKAQKKIRRGLDQLTACPRDAEVAISHIQKFIERNRKSSRRDESGDINSRKRAARPERSDLANAIAHRVLREQMCCTCQGNGVRRQMERGHLVCLLLQPPSQSVASNSLVQFDMLFSSKPFWDQSQLTHWQDIELLVPNGHTHGKKELAQVAPAAGLRGVSRRVRIAILDTGYDDNAPFFFSPDVMERLKGWKDWADGSSQPEDCHGHGTHLVSLVLRCAPDADIYVARIAKSPHQLLNSSDQVAEAISWASGEWEADIISMSFGFADEQPCISDAIREALYKRKDSILFFAAASNYGANDREMFPARHESVISIRGTNSNGLFADFNPPKHEDEPVDFGTLGIDVPSAWPNSDGEEYRSGTSVATAIAAGIAGSLLGYISSRPPEKPFYNAENRAWTRRGMNAIFRAISSNTLQSGYLYLTVRGLIGIPEDARWAKIGGKLSGL
ncbi:hypothetical protein RIB2604_01902090 [Aspergillus luchuensis]|uniref:Peptidase S8/S53 domain-containing protein n=1 Tax=Aspergillus kawachii TaxID=1069201 RepID=A0A146FH58_ASPKA|nr:hypothetical protein RIB2604_01902090 [Aspergillus luchuensis]